jgi:hypothetical protein
VLERKVDLERFAVREGDVPLHHPARHVLELVDGVSTLGELVERTWLAPFRLWEVMHHLRMRDWVEEVDPASVHEATEEGEELKDPFWRPAVLFVAVALASLAFSVGMRDSSMLSLLGFGDPIAKVRLEVRSRPGRLWERALVGKPPVDANLPASYGSGP